MDYLKQQNQASVPALFAVSRYLLTQPNALAEGDLQRVLRPPAMFAGRPGEPALMASLEVGADIQLLTSWGRRDQRSWALREDLHGEVESCSRNDDSRAFRSIVLRLLGIRAVGALRDGESPPDVALALTWLLLEQNPLTPLSTSWSEGPEEAFRKAHMDQFVRNVEQWRALVRWGRSLGVLTEIQTASSRGRPRLLVDPTSAIREVLAELPARAPAGDWFNRLRAILPLLGSPALAGKVNVHGSQVPEALALALHKLEFEGHLRLITADDARDAVALRLGGRAPRLVAEIRKEAAA